MNRQQRRVPVSFFEFFCFDDAVFVVLSLDANLSSFLGEDIEDIAISSHTPPPLRIQQDESSVETEEEHSAADEFIGLYVFVCLDVCVCLDVSEFESMPTEEDESIGTQTEEDQSQTESDESQTEADQSQTESDEPTPSVEASDDDDDVPMNEPPPPATGAPPVEDDVVDNDVPMNEPPPPATGAPPVEAVHQYADGYSATDYNPPPTQLEGSDLENSLECVFRFFF